LTFSDRYSGTYSSAASRAIRTRLPVEDLRGDDVFPVAAVAHGQLVLLAPAQKEGRVHILVEPQAAVYLRPELEDELRQHSDDVAPLPDLFSAELGLPALGSLPAGAALDALGDLHHRLSGQAYNWAGSYRQHIPLFLRQLKRHARPRETVPKQK